MPIIGSTLKPFTSQAFKEGKFIQVTEADVAGKWAVFFFYPADFTFVCPTELEDMADLYGEFQKLGVEIYSVSCDTHFSHKAWHETSPAVGKIRYFMLGDQSGQITNNFGVMREGAGLADRATFLVDPEGVIRFVYVTEGSVGRNPAEVLRVLDAFGLQEGRTVRWLPNARAGTAVFHFERLASGASAPPKGAAPAR